MIVEFGLRLKALCADITDELAIARVELGMSFQKSGLLEALVAAFEIADKSFGRSRCSSRGHDGGHAAVAGRGDALDDGDLLATGGAENVSATATGGDYRRPCLPGVDQALNKGSIGTQHGAGRPAGVQVSHGGHFTLALVLGLFLERQRLGTGKHLTNGYGQRFT